MKRKWLLVLPAIREAHTEGWRSIKYRLFPPLGLASLASWLPQNDEIRLADEHVEIVPVQEHFDVVMIEVYITNAYRAYQLADHYRAMGSIVILGGLHVTALPEEAESHADAVFLGPADGDLRWLIQDLLDDRLRKRYVGVTRDITAMPLPRRDLIHRHQYLVPNSLTVSRGCPHSCSFCYTSNFYSGGRRWYTASLDRALQEIDSLPGRHLFFLDDNLLAPGAFTRELLRELVGRNRLIQGAGTVQAILEGDTAERAAKAGLRSLFVGFETLEQQNLLATGKRHNLGNRYREAVHRLQANGIRTNASFVFGLDHDDPDVFRRTVDWAVEAGVTTATFHIATPYPGTRFHEELSMQGRIFTQDWNQYDTRHVVFQPKVLTVQALQDGYHWCYREFYAWKNIARASSAVPGWAGKLSSLAYTVGWKKLEPLWDMVIRLQGLPVALQIFEAVLSAARPAAISLSQEPHDVSFQGHSPLGIEER